MSSFLETVSQAISKSLDNQTVELKPARGGGGAGGGGASVSAAVDSKTDTKYFIKSARGQHGCQMLEAEYFGVKEMSETNTIRVPKPIAFGKYGDNNAFVVFEYLEMGGYGGGSSYDMGRQLAQMHRSVSKTGQFGFHLDNTIGATPQPNPWTDSWIDFWDNHRLGHMLKLTDNCGFSKDDIAKFRTKTRQLLSTHDPSPSLIHGDLWSGNKGFARTSSGEVVPVIFDPATYYGDREAELAMTYVFGGFSGDFYKGYEDEWPLPEGHEKRRKSYELYHILNHCVLFGGGYCGQARNMIMDIMNS